MVDNAEGLAAKFEALVHTVIHTPMFSGFCYTQFTDTFQEANGLMAVNGSRRLRWRSARVSSPRAACISAAASDHPARRRRPAQAARKTDDVRCSPVGMLLPKALDASDFQRIQSFA